MINQELLNISTGIIDKQTSVAAVDKEVNGKLVDAYDCNKRLMNTRLTTLEDQMTSLATEINTVTANVTTLKVTGNTNLNNLTVTCPATLNSSLTVNGCTHLNSGADISTLKVTGNTNLNNLTVTCPATLNSNLTVSGCTELVSASINTINNATINDPKLSNISTQSSPATNILTLDSDGCLHTACSVCCKMCNCRGQARLATFDLRGFDWRLTSGACLLSQASLQVSCHNFSSGCVDDPYRITIQTCCETNYSSNIKDWRCNCVALNNYAVCILARCDMNSQNAHSLCSYIIVCPDKICLCNTGNPGVTGSDLEICRNCITFRTGCLSANGSTFTFRDGSLQLLNGVHVICLACKEYSLASFMNCLAFCGVITSDEAKCYLDTPSAARFRFAATGVLCCKDTYCNDASDCNIPFDCLYVGFLYSYCAYPIICFHEITAYCCCCVTTIGYPSTKPTNCFGFTGLLIRFCD